jgi:hypothetical protein
MSDTTNNNSINKCISTKTDDKSPTYHITTLLNKDKDICLYDCSDVQTNICNNLHECTRLGCKSYKDFLPKDTSMEDRDNMRNENMRNENMRNESRSNDYNRN